MNSWRNNNLLPTDKETFINAKMNNLMNFLNAEDLSSNKEIVSEIHFDESLNLKEATHYNPKAYNFAASGFHMTLDELEDTVKSNKPQLDKLISQDKGIQNRYKGVKYSEEKWLEKINYLRESIEFYKPEKFGTQYIKGYRSITLNKFLDFNQEQPGICWAFNKEYQQKNEKNFILHGTGHGSSYLLRLKAAFKNSDIDWVKTVYLIKNDEGELRLHPGGKAYVLDKRIYNLAANRTELEVEDIADFERKANISLPLAIRYFYNPETGRYDINHPSLDMSSICKDGELIVPIGTWNGDFSAEGLSSFKNMPIRVTGNFACGGWKNLTSLEGVPEYVGGNFYCGSNNNLVSLKGAPKYVGGGFYCSGCGNLTSLEGAPKEVGGDFDCSHCHSLTSLEGAPEKVKGSFLCSVCNNLTSLEGAPRYVGRIDCSYCDNLTSLEGAPEKVKGNFLCLGCSNLTSLDGASEYVGGIFDCSMCYSLASLEGAPKKVGKDFNCNSCLKLTTLIGAPEKVGRDLNCSSCKGLTSLKGAPEYVGRDLYCEFCVNLTSLEGAPKEVGRDFDCYTCGRRFTEDEIRAICNVKEKVHC